MRNALSLREHAAQCLEIARHLSDLAAATKLRAEAARCLAGEQAIELKVGRRRRDSRPARFVRRRLSYSQPVSPSTPPAANSQSGLMRVAKATVAVAAVISPATTL